MSEVQVRHRVNCAECDFPMVLLTSDNARYPKSGKFRKYYRCARFPKCDGTCGAHPDGSPLGIPGDSETRKLRYDLHRVFDQLWITQRWSRQEAYYILQILTGLGEDDAHVACFDKNLCRKLMLQIKEFLMLNPHKQGNSRIGTPSKYRFVNVVRSCPTHGDTVHQVYLEGREVFCQKCLETGRGQVWRSFLLFKR